MMKVERFNSLAELKGSSTYAPFKEFLGYAEHAHFFQAPEFLEFIEPVAGYRPVLFIAVAGDGSVKGSLLAAYQSDGSALKAWLSRRLIIWGGPLGGAEAASTLLDALLHDAAGKAIYVEFRNYFDTEAMRPVFEAQGFTFRPHLNFVVTLGSEEEEALKLISSNRRRQIKTSLAAGAEFREPNSEAEVDGFYELLATLYKGKVGKPLPDPSLFRQFHNSPSGRMFVVVYEGKVIGGSAGPVYNGQAIYQWYVCGDNSIKGVHASVLATWAQIAYGANKGYKVFDFMGAGRPGQGYGVYDFKARFGGEELAHGRYEKILNKPLYKLGVHGLKLYHKMTGSKEKKS